MVISYSPVAIKWLSSSSPYIRKRIINKIKFFASQENPKIYAVRLVDSKSYRFRIGDYRVICDIGLDLIDVLVIGKRDEIYR